MHIFIDGEWNKIVEELYHIHNPVIPYCIHHIFQRSARATLLRLRGTKNHEAAYRQQ